MYMKCCRCGVCVKCLVKCIVLVMLVCRCVLLVGDVWFV